MLWKFAKCPGKFTKCPGKTSSVLDIFGNGKGAPKCLELISEHQKPQSFQEPLEGPGPQPQFSPSFHIFSPKGTHIPGIAQKNQQCQKKGFW